MATTTVRPAASAPAGRRRPVASVLAAWAVLTPLGLLVAWGLWWSLELTSPGRDGPTVVPPLLVAGVTVLALLVAALPGWYAARRAASPDAPAAVGAVLASGSVILGGVVLGSLRGTAWGLDGLWSDAGFRTQTVTRYADSPGLADYAYDGLAAYYPPLLPWLQGRVAALLDVPGWTVMKPAQVLVCVLLPLLAWLLWRRVLPDLTAAWVAVVVAVATVLAHKPDEWLVLCLLLPWWLEVCRGTRRDDVPEWGVVRHGVVLGLLLLCHTYFFLPLGLATLLGAATDVVRRRPVRPAPGRALAIGAVGLVVSLPTWWHLLLAQAAGQPGDDLQRRWSSVGFDVPAVPLPYDARGALELVGVVWLVVCLRHGLRHSRLAAALLLALVTSYVVHVGGQLAQPLGLAVLPEKSEELSEAVLAAAGVLGLGAAARRWRGRTGRRTTVAAAAVVVLLAGALAWSSLQRGIVDHASPAQTMRYPDGSFPAGGPVPSWPTWHPWGVAPGDERASVEQVSAAWRDLAGSDPDNGLVLLSARADLPAVVPVHLFLPWKSIYSHPFGGFEERLEVVRSLAACTTPACARDLLRDNEVEPVDGLVLNEDSRGYYLSVTLDTFPDAWERERVSFDPALFDDSAFQVERLAGTVVVRVAD